MSNEKYYSNPRSANVGIYNPFYEPLLNDLQAHILKHHGRDHAYHILLQFDKKADPKAIKQWIANLPITNAKKQLHDAAQHRLENSFDGEMVTCFYLSAAGYKFLGLEKHMPTDPAFSKGMKLSREKLQDPPISDWNPEFQQDIHAMVLVADDDLKKLKRLVKTLRVETASLVTTPFGFTQELGQLIYNQEGQPIEPFGYRDGISQPVFLSHEIDYQSLNENWSAAAPLDLLLVPEPKKAGPQSFGSYAVFRKLEQNVKGFKEAEEKLAERLFKVTEPFPSNKPKSERDAWLEALEKNHNRREIVGAMLFGRFEDGTPISLSEKENGQGSNNFNFEKDEGKRCPYHAHIRKMNPRSPESRDRLIARRGMPYDERPPGDYSEPDPEYGVGLLFLAFQSNLEEQFEALQCMANGLPKDSGLDPIIGQCKENEPLHQKWTAYDVNPPKEELGFKGFVTLRGGEYFFAPSLSFLTSLANLADVTPLESLHSPSAERDPTPAVKRSNPPITHSVMENSMFNPLHWADSDPSQDELRKPLFLKALIYYHSARTHLMSYVDAVMRGGPTVPPPPPPPPLFSTPVIDLQNMSFWIPYFRYAGLDAPDINAWLETPDGVRITQLAHPIKPEEVAVSTETGLERSAYYVKATFQGLPGLVVPAEVNTVILRISAAGKARYSSNEVNDYRFEEALEIGLKR